jgi:hypothetical protein
MSFREKTAWIMLIGIVLVTLVCVSHLPWSLNPRSTPLLLHVLALSVSAFLVFELVAYVVLYVRHPNDARTPKDERERWIELKAVQISARVYVVGSFVAVSTIHAGANVVAVAYGVVLAFAIAEIVNYAARIVFYRRGS